MWEVATAFSSRFITQISLPEKVSLQTLTKLSVGKPLSLQMLILGEHLTTGHIYTINLKHSTNELLFFLLYILLLPFRNLYLVLSSYFVLCKLIFMCLFNIFFLNHEYYFRECLLFKCKFTKNESAV